MQVQIVIQNACTISTAPGTMDFSTHSSNDATDATSSQTFDVTCTNLAPYTIGFSGGASGNTSARTMALTIGANTYHVGYQLYQDTGAITTVWGDSGSADAKSATGSGSAQPYTVYGRVPAANFNVPAGTYTDTVQLQVTY
jgi:spore coat protein U-like protein